MADGQQYSPVYVLHFGTKLSVEDIEWVLKKLTQKKDEGGAEVTIACAPPSIDQVLQLFWKTHCDFNQFDQSVFDNFDQFLVILGFDGICFVTGG